MSVAVLSAPDGAAAIRVGRYGVRPRCQAPAWICPGGARASVHSELLGVATRYPGHLPFPDAHISPIPHPHALGSAGVAGAEESELRVSLVGVSCVGTTTIGRMLADRRGWPFFDLDDEIERHFGTSIERLQARFLTSYSYRKECAVVLERIATANSDCVIALPPSGLRDAFLRVLRRVPGVTVAIHDTPENIMERITFYDIDSRRIDKQLTDEERILQLKEIKADISYFKRPYERADLHVTIAGLDPEASAAAIDARLGRT